MRHVSVVSLIVLGTLAVPRSDAAGPNLKAIEKQFASPVVWVPRPTAPPTIDGNLDEDCWKTAQPVTLGYATGAWWDVPSQKTEARVLADDRAIYFAVRCFESEPQRVVGAGAVRKGMIEGADTVEIFLDPGCRGRRHEYFHIIVTPDGTVYRGRGLDPDAWKATVTAKVGKFDGGWTVEAAVPLQDLGLEAGAIPRVWGLNVCRQRPELGFDMPKAARAAGPKRFDPPMWKLDEPGKYRFAEHTAWSPTMADFCGWPFYNDSRPFHIAQRFGRAVLEVGTKEVMPPARTFEILFKGDFDDGQIGPFKNAVLHDDNFRGPGKSLGFAEGQSKIQFTRMLEDLDDVTLILVFKLKEQVEPLPHLSITGRAPDGIWCGAERYEYFLPTEEADARSRYLEEYHQQKYGAGPFALYDTHADMVRWKPCGRVRPGPGGWAMVEGIFAEPSGGQVRWPGKDWVIVRIRPGLFRRAPGPKQGQKLVPLSQSYPDGLTFAANPHDGFRLDEVVLFRGADTEPPARVTGLTTTRKGEDVELSWHRSRDNTLTAFYRVYADGRLLAETHRLTTRIKAAVVAKSALTVVAVDLYGNASEPSKPLSATER